MNHFVTKVFISMSIIVLCSSLLVAIEKEQLTDNNSQKQKLISQLEKMKGVDITETDGKVVIVVPYNLLFSAE